jgi:DNA topoisomerase-1
MSKKLVIVESPSKSKTIEKYLGNDYKVVSSLGHIRDLATNGKYGLGIDIDNNFKPNYEIIKGKKKLVTDLKKEVKDASYVYLATDPDREGEAISWHLYDTLGLKENSYKRIVFNEITKDVILGSFAKARDIDDNLVKSQETRRMLDRIIGFRLSKLMQSKTGGKSAGRVQSVALKLIVDREREIEAFIPEDYYEIDAIFNEFEAKLDTYKDKKIEIKTEAEAKDIISKLSDEFKISKLDKQLKNKKAKPPYITSTLQQDASTKLNFVSKKTMMLAQKLYEGVSLKDETVGLITYMRTDSIRLSDEFIRMTYGYIKNTYGDDYVGYVKTTKKTDNVQDAHEAIRPTSIYRTPETVKPYLSNDEYKLYKMIYFRALASLMKDAKVEATTVVLDNNDYQFKATGSILVFDGYLKVYSDYEENSDVILPDFSKYPNGVLKSNEINYTMHTTKPPARYTESKLIKEMETLGIGRPSTYATTVGILSERGYVKVIDKKFHPTEIGIETTDKLQEYFKDIINVDYTRDMEVDLYKIAYGNFVYTKFLTLFFD